MPGNYSHTTRADGTILTAAIYNADHQNHIDHMTAAGVDSFETTVTEKQIQTAPSVGLAASLGEDLAHLRYIINKLGGGTTYWYEIGGPPTDLQMLDLAVAAVGAKKSGVLVPREGTITKVLAYSDVAPTGADLIFDLKKNGASIWGATPANRVKVVQGFNLGSQTAFDAPLLAEADRLDLDIVQVGSGVAGGNWSRIVVLVKPNLPP